MYNFLYKHLDFIRISDLLGNLGIITIGSNTEKRLCFKSPLFCYDCISPPLQLVSLSMPNSSDFLKMAIKIRRENWKKRNVFVVRDGGKLLSWVNVKGSKLNLLSAKNLFKKNNTFKKGVKKEVTKLTNMVEIKEFQEVKFSKGQLPVLFSSKLKTTKQKAKVLQYIISAKLKNTIMSARDILVFFIWRTLQSWHSILRNRS